MKTRARRKMEKEALAFLSCAWKNKKGRRWVAFVNNEGLGPTTKVTTMAEIISFGASDGFDEEGRNDRRNIQFPKSICFAGFGDIEICVQDLCEKTVLPL